jgi:hypothetical protein
MTSLKSQDRQNMASIKIAFDIPSRSTMMVKLLALAVIFSHASAFAPNAKNYGLSKPLQAEKDSFSLWKSAANPLLATLLGWTLAGQMASASLPTMNEQQGMK